MKTNLSSLVLALVLTGGSVSRAFAQTAPAPHQEADAEAVATAAPVSVKAANADPNLDRGFLLPTAMTQPAGTVTYNNYELLLHGISYGLTDNIQASVTVLSPIVKDMPFFGFASVKGHLAAGPRLHLALQVSGAYGTLLGQSDGGNVFSGGLGAFASLCLRDDCSSLLSASGTYQLAFNSAGNTAGLIVYGGSIVQRVSDHIKLLGEVTAAAGSTSDTGLDSIPTVLVSYGVRFHTSKLAGDVGFIRPVGAGDDGLLMGLPFASLSYRWN